MKAPAHGPDGIELIAAAVHAWEASKQKVADAEAMYRAAQAEERATHKRLTDLVAHGRCVETNGAHPHAPPAGAKPRPNGAALALKPTAPCTTPRYDLSDKKVPIVWRIAFQLLADPVLDYAAVGEQIWGPGLPLKTVKNRLSSNLAYLCKAEIGVATAVGSNTFKIDKEKLAEKSKLPVEAAP